MITFSTPGCSVVTATFCYTCDPTRNYTHVEILEMSGITSPECIDPAWDYVYEWVLEHPTELCDGVPCDQGSRTIEITKFMCADMIWNGEMLTIKPDRTACDRRCTNEYEWCYCNCTPDCDPDPECIPHNQYTFVSQTIIGNGDCVFTPYGDGTKYEFDDPDPWEIHCQWFDCPQR